MEETIKTSKILKFIKDNIGSASCYQDEHKKGYNIMISKENFRMTFHIFPLEGRLYKLDYINTYYKGKKQRKEYDIVLTSESLNSLDVRVTEDIETLIVENFESIKAKTVKGDAIKALYTIDKIIKEVK